MKFIQGLRGVMKHAMQKHGTKENLHMRTHGQRWNVVLVEAAVGFLGTARKAGQVSVGSVVLFASCSSELCPWMSDTQLRAGLEVLLRLRTFDQSCSAMGGIHIVRRRHGQGVSEGSVCVS